ncbi:transporter substrate-binding domain-containing protein [Shewanella mesophila]|uniref:substrate-binding periplasmic protein n=1 Tax=Shewanella mesophila TaxID=2864208 RepID=UPI001C65E45C|nr:transporter substrate-binding domain-containing protein [Shewanella mesophila]QYJ85469.1 transporter substrate-binding domain-containing protein [Shewanella mesophila]
MRFLLFLLCYVLPVFTLLANPTPQGISFAVSNSIPPYFFADRKSGIQYDLLKSALATQQLTIKQLYFSPNKRAIRQVKTHLVDCLINAPENIEGLFYTDNVIDYQNSLFTLTSSELTIQSVADLAHLSLNGFQNATRYLGEEFKLMAALNPNYSESNSQRSQVLMLFTKRVDAVVLERRIFAYYKEQLTHRIDTSSPVSEHQIFAPAQRKIACFDSKLTEQINKGIKQINAKPSAE